MSAHVTNPALPPASVTIGGSPTDDEVAAIVAAVVASIPTADGAAAAVAPARWKFSGRWWAKPVPLARDRPW
ncbi:MAG: hypothetical protein OEY23_00710 [Acidimicrobiia bacterium]|nr:hypothetical protein [Acidimicrobiia bacterium]